MTDYTGFLLYRSVEKPYRYWINRFNKPIIFEIMPGDKDELVEEAFPLEVESTSDSKWYWVGVHGKPGSFGFRVRPENQGVFEMTDERKIIANLNFPLPEQRNAFDIAAHAMDYALAWHDLKEWVRSELKYHELSDDDEIALRRLQKYILELEQDYTLPRPE